MAHNNFFAKSAIMLESQKIYRKLKCSNQMETIAVYLICLKKNPASICALLLLEIRRMSLLSTRKNEQTNESK